MSSVALTWWQGGLESTHGTAVAAARKLYGIGPIPTEERVKEYVKQSRRNYVANFDAVETHTKVEFDLEEPILSFQDLTWWLALAAEGGVTPTGAGPYVWLFDNVGTSDNLKSATFEVSDGVGTFQVPYALLETWEIAGKGGVNEAGVVSGKFGFMAQKVTGSHTMTAALADRDLRGDYMPFHLTQFYMDDAAGGIGGTENGTLMEFSIKGANKFETLYFGGDSGYYGNHRRDKRTVEVMVKLLFDATSYAEFEDRYQANTGRFCRLKIANGASRDFKFDFYTKMEKFEWPEDGATRAVTLMGQTIYDPTLGFDWQISLTNSVASIA